MATKLKTLVVIRSEDALDAKYSKEDHVILDVVLFRVFVLSTLLVIFKVAEGDSTTSGAPV